MQKITPCLWFDHQAEEAAKYYVSIFSARGGSASGGKHAKILDRTHYGEEGKEIHKQKAGTVLTVEFELNGQHFTAFNAGPLFKFNEAISFVVNCEDQDEVDYYWNKLSEGGDPNAQQCGWLKDKFGLSWQVVPTVMAELMADTDKAAAGRTMNAMLKMKKLDIAALQAAHDKA